MKLMIIGMLVLLGLCFGSFVNALAWRLHQQEALADTTGKAADTKRWALSILRGRSMCPDCHHQLGAGDLIPVLSWVGLGGKCRYCHRPISWHYPLVEIAVAALFVLSYVVWPYDFSGVLWVRFVFWLVFLVGFMALVISDLKWMLLPDRIVYSLLGLAITQTLVMALLQRDWQLIVGSLYGFAVLGGLFYGLFQLSKGKWIGGGDVKLGFCLGVLVGGPVAAVLVLFLSSVLGTGVAIPLLVSGKAKRDTRIPYGPFLLLAATITVLFGSTILAWYQRQFL